MDVRSFSVRIAGMLLALMLVTGAAISASVSARHAHLPALAKPVSQIDAWAVVLDPGAPVAERRRILARFEKHAASAGQRELYILGSLYQMGDRAPGALVKQDLDKAGLYLSNAAVNGSILAMAKMAEIELAKHEYPAAMIWAQIFAHYAAVMIGNKHAQGYAAELVHRVIEKLGQSGVADAMPAVSLFIEQHDAQIRAGAGSGHAGDPSRRASKTRPYLTPAGRFMPHSGIADFLIAFKSDGSVAYVWVLDAVPDSRLGIDLRAAAAGMKIAPETGVSSDAMRYRWMPVILDDGRYKVSAIH